MTLQEIYARWKPVWDREPKLKPDDYFLSDGVFRNGTLIVAVDDAIARIKWTAMEWLAERGW